MRIPDRLLKTVGFVSRFDPEEDGARLMFGGNAFIVGIRTDKKFSLAHLVTAKHVAEAIEPAEAVCAMNAKHGEALYLRTGNEQWFYHPTEPDKTLQNEATRGERALEISGACRLVKSCSLTCLRPQPNMAKLWRAPTR